MDAWFVLASGPSMTAEDAAAVAGHGRVIAIGETWALAPWADLLYSADPAWWRERAPPASAFPGRRACLDLPGAPDTVCAIPSREAPGLGVDVVHRGSNSGYQAINLAFLWGAASIVLLGFDMQHTGGRHHWHADHLAPLGNFAIGMPELCRPKFTPLAVDLERHGVRVINASRTSALECFERLSLVDAIAQVT